MANEDIQELVNGGLDASLRLTIPLTFLILLDRVRGGGGRLRPAGPRGHRAARRVRRPRALQPGRRPGKPVREPAHRADRARRGGRLLAVHGDPLPDRAAPRAASKQDAIRVASATAGRAVFFSGLAVMFSIGGLFLLDDNLFRSMAIGTIAVVLIAVIGSLTFLPATLAILGDNVDRLRVPLLASRSTGRQRALGGGRPRRDASTGDRLPGRRCRAASP